MSELRAALADALGPLHRVEREVRSIGEYRLFVATWIPTGPELLVKVLPAAISLAIAADKFERDVLLLADQLRHPHLVTPRGAGRAGACLYHTRPFIAGTTLHAWMAKNGPVPLARVDEIIRGVLGGLAHAHGNGVAHGDLRAENVLLGANGVVVADVGIARVLGGNSSSRDDMGMLIALVREMLADRRHHPREEPLERVRTLPSWLTEWMDTPWQDAGKALAALRPPPPTPPSFGSRASQPVV